MQLTTLNEKGQCPVCERKPLVYKRKNKKFCAECYREFALDTGEQIENWAWERSGSGFRCTAILPDNPIYEEANAGAETIFQMFPPGPRRIAALHKMYCALRRKQMRVIGGLATPLAQDRATQ